MVSCQLDVLGWVTDAGAVHGPPDSWYCQPAAVGAKVLAFTWTPRTTDSSLVLITPLAPAAGQLSTGLAVSCRLLESVLPSPAATATTLCVPALVAVTTACQLLQLWAAASSTTVTAAPSKLRLTPVTLPAGSENAVPCTVNGIPTNSGAVAGVVNATPTRVTGGGLPPPFLGISGFSLIGSPQRPRRSFDRVQGDGERGRRLARCGRDRERQGDAHVHRRPVNRDWLVDRSGGGRRVGVRLVIRRGYAGGDLKLRRAGA